MAFRTMVCTYNRKYCDGCPVQRTCPYPTLFETPTATGKQNIKRMRDIPHPIVIEPPLQHSDIYHTGSRMTFDVVLFGNQLNKVPYLIFSVNEMAGTGLGRQRIPFRLLEVHNSNDELIYTNETGKMLRDGIIERLSEDPILSQSPDEITLYFLTPFRSKENHKIANRFDMQQFLSNACRRLWAMMVYHHSINPDELDFRPLLTKTEMPDVAAQSLEWTDLTRYSNRQKRKIEIGGMVGHVVLKNNLEPFLPVLAAVSKCHIGKSAVMGLGQIKLQPNTIVETPV